MPEGVVPEGVAPGEVSVLPRQPVVGSNTASAAAHPVAKGATDDSTDVATAPAPARPRVLLVEDDADLRAYLAAFSSRTAGR